MTPAGNDTARLLAGWCHHPACRQAAEQALEYCDDGDDELLQAAVGAVCRLGTPCRQRDGSADSAGTRLFVELVAERYHALHARRRFQARQQRLEREREQRESRRRRAKPKAAPPISKNEVLAAIARARAKRQTNG